MCFGQFFFFLFVAGAVGWRVGLMRSLVTIKTHHLARTALSLIARGSCFCVAAGPCAYDCGGPPVAYAHILMLRSCNQSHSYFVFPVRFYLSRTIKINNSISWVRSTVGVALVYSFRFSSYMQQVPSLRCLREPHKQCTYKIDCHRLLRFGLHTLDRNLWACIWFSVFPHNGAFFSCCRRSFLVALFVVFFVSVHVGLAACGRAIVCVCVW